MKWLNDIFSGKKDSKKTTGLALSQINSWLEERSRSSSFEENLQNTYESVGEVAQSLAGSVRALEASDPDASAPPKLLRAGLAARSEIIKQMESLTEKLKPPRGRDIDSASEHHWALVKGLGNTVQKFGRAQRYVAALFPHESEAINSDFNRLSRLLVQLEEEIGKNRKEREEIWFSRELVARIPQELKEIDVLRDRVKRDEQKLAELQDTLKRDEAEIKRLASSDEGRKVEELKKTLNAKREELKEIEAEIADLVAPLTKALSRAMKQEASDRISLQHREILEMLSRAPLQALDGDISGPLQEVRSHMAVLGLKDRKKEKVLDHLDYLIAKKPLEALKARHVKLQAEVKDLEKQLAECTSGSVLLNKDLVRTRKEIERLEPELSLSRQSLADLEEKASNDEAELKERVGKIAGSPVEIDMGIDTGQRGHGGQD